MIDAIAEIEDVDPVSGQFCLHDHVDPDALDALVASVEDGFSLTFTVDEYAVTVDADGSVAVTDPEPGSVR